MNPKKPLLKPKILFTGKDRDYYEAKVDRKHLEGMIHKYDAIDKQQLVRIINSLETGKDRIPANKLETYGGIIPLRNSIIVKETGIDGKTVIESLEKFFRRATTYAQVHRAPYVLVQKLNIYEMGSRGNMTYEITGLAQLLIE